MNDPQPNRAGMVCFNLAGEVLVVSALSSPNCWVFPKGHIEKDEDPYEAAEREIREEAGVRAITTGDSIGTTTYVYKGETILCEWYAGIASGRVTGLEADQCEAAWGFRTAKWVPWRTALDLLSFPSLRGILREALALPPEEGEEKVTLTDTREVQS